MTGMRENRAEPTTWRPGDTRELSEEVLKKIQIHGHYHEVTERSVHLVDLRIGIVLTVDEKRVRHLTLSIVPRTT
jgi:hypothetical protein